MMARERKGLNVEVPAKGTYTRRTDKYVIIEGEVCQGPAGSIGREVSIYLPHQVIERLTARPATPAVIDLPPWDEATDEECDEILKGDW